jgi:hypothetical protein
VQVVRLSAKPDGSGAPQDPGSVQQLCNKSVASAAALAVTPQVNASVASSGPR